jgi:hypothetical protein
MTTRSRIKLSAALFSLLLLIQCKTIQSVTDTDTNLIDETTDVITCSKHGIRLQNGLCQCKDGYTGDSCEFKICNNTTTPVQLCHSDFGVCDYSNNDTTCTCINSNYTGTACQIFSCYGRNSSDSEVCSGNGQCTRLNECTCFDNYSGANCDVAHCFGLASNDSQACNGNGICVAPDLCICDDDYYGDTCKNFTCYSNSDNATECNNRGVCMSHNHCSCNAGFYGQLCQHAVTCFGITDGVHVCSGHGQCVADDICICDNEYTGEECSILISSTSNTTNTTTCFGVNVTDAAVCSGHGHCIHKDNCTCNIGYNGVNCSYPTCFNQSSNSSNVCSGHGKCIDKDTCLCSSGYSGLICNTTTTGNTSSITCKGIDSQNPSVCSGHGACVSQDQCTCQSEYHGSDCDSYYCYGLFKDHSLVCSGVGTCVAPDQCMCINEGYLDNCNVTECSSIRSDNPIVCSGFGICEAPNSCICPNNTRGFNCEYNVCYGKLETDINICGKHGECIEPDSCKCNKGYEGLSCDISICFNRSSTNPKVCSSHGLCSAADTCQCYSSPETGFWIGSNCSTCAPNYKNENCTEKICDPVKTCSSHGSCNMQTFNCMCDGHYALPFCDVCSTNYYGGNCTIFCNSRTTCSGHGVCNSINGTIPIGGCNCTQSSTGGYFDGTNCEKCMDGFYGSDCLTVAPSGFIFGNTSDRVSGKFSAPSYTEDLVECSRVIHASDLSLIGSSASCGWMDQDSKVTGRFTIIFGYRATILPAQQLRFNILFNENKIMYIPVTMAAPLSPPTPVASLFSPSKISVCEGITIDASGSFSSDGRPLTYLWKAVSGGGLTDLNKYLQDKSLQTSSIVSISDSLLFPDNTYEIQVQAVSFLGVKSVAKSVTFSKSSQALAVAYIGGGSQQSIYYNDVLTLDPYSTQADCFYSDRRIAYIWSQVSGSDVLSKGKKSGNSLIFDKASFPPVDGSKYIFELNLQPYANANPPASSLTRVTITLNLHQLIARIDDGLSKKKVVTNINPLVIDASASYDPSEIGKLGDFVADDIKGETFAWSCVNLATYGLCPSAVDQLLILNQNNKVTIPAGSLPEGSYRISLLYKKGSRASDTYVDYDVIATNAPPIVFTTTYNPLYRYLRLNNEDTVAIKASIPSAYADIYNIRTWTLSRLYRDLVRTTQVQIGSGTNIATGVGEKYENMIFIPGSSLIVGATYYLEFQAKNSQGTGGKSTIIFQVSPVPLIGCLELVPSSGKASLTSFAIVAANWRSYSGDSNNLKYKFEVYDNMAPKSVLERVLTSMSQAKMNRVTSMHLPTSIYAASGIPINGTVNIAVTVTDFYGAKAKIVAPVSILPISHAPEAEKLNALTTLISNIKAGDTITGWSRRNSRFALVDTVLSLINNRIEVTNVDWRKDVRFSLYSLINDFFTGVDSKVVWDVEDINQIGTSLKIMTKQLSELNPATQQGICQLIEKMFITGTKTLTTDMQSVVPTFIAVLSNLVSSEYPGVVAAAKKDIVLLTSKLINKDTTVPGEVINIVDPVSGINAQMKRMSKTDIKANGVSLSIASTGNSSSSISIKFPTSFLPNALDIVNVDFQVMVYQTPPVQYTTAGGTMKTQSVSVDVRYPDGRAIQVNNLSPSNSILITIPGDFAALLKDPSITPVCAYNQYNPSQSTTSSWVTDNTCEVVSIDATSWTCACTHLTMFGGVASVPLPKPSIIAQPTIVVAPSSTAIAPEPTATESIVPDNSTIPHASTSKKSGNTGGGDDTGKSLIPTTYIIVIIAVGAAMLIIVLVVIAVVICIVCKGTCRSPKKQRDKKKQKRKGGYQTKNGQFEIRAGAPVKRFK